MGCRTVTSPVAGSLSVGYTNRFPDPSRYHTIMLSCFQFLLVWCMGWRLQQAHRDYSTRLVQPRQFQLIKGRSPPLSSASAHLFPCPIDRPTFSPASDNIESIYDGIVPHLKTAKPDILRGQSRKLQRYVDTECPAEMLHSIHRKQLMFSCSRLADAFSPVSSNMIARFSAVVPDVISAW